MHVIILNISIIKGSHTVPVCWEVAGITTALANFEAIIESEVVVVVVEEVEEEKWLEWTNCTEITSERSKKINKKQKGCWESEIFSLSKKIFVFFCFFITFTFYFIFFWFELIF